MFVGCPYGGKFPFAAFRATLDRVPFRWYYADTNISKKHLLGVLRSYIKAVDYCVFDISLWNANVALEIGLAEGLGVQYYILLNRKLSRGVPADIQGLQRIEYDDPKGVLDSSTLLSRIIKYLVRPHTHPKNIYAALSGANREAKFTFALSVLAHLRDNKYLSHNDISHLVQGTYLCQGRMKTTSRAGVKIRQSKGRREWWFGFWQGEREGELPLAIAWNA